MTYVAPVSADLKARFPEFAPVSDALVNSILTEAGVTTNDTWLDRDRATAQLYLAAHLLASEGEPGRTNNGTSTSTGVVKRRKAGNHEIEYAVPDQKDATTLDADYSATVYGKRFLLLMRLNFPAVAVV